MECQWLRWPQLLYLQRLELCPWRLWRLSLVQAKRNRINANGRIMCSVLNVLKYLHHRIAMEGKFLNCKI